MRTLAILAFGSFAAGLVVVVHGIVTDNAARSAAGASLTITGLTFFALCLVRKWISDTSRERDRQLDAARASHDERTRYIAAQAAMEIERQRMQRDVSAERAHLAVRLAAEQAAMRDRFEEERATLICETFEAAVLMVQAGVLNDLEHGREHAQVIGLFPQQPAREREQQPAPDGTRGRGVSRT